MTVTEMADFMAGSTGLEPATSGLTVPVVDRMRHLNSQHVIPSSLREQHRVKW
jgi:hypothetical protein